MDLSKKTRYNKFKRLVFILIAIILILIVAKNLNIIFDYENNIEKIKAFDDMKPGVVEFLDSYDSENMSFEECINDPDFLVKEKNVSEKLFNNDVFEYYDLYFQSVNYYGDYVYEDKLEHLVLNEKYDGEINTYCEGIIMSKKYYEDFELESKLESGIGFEDDFEVGVDGIIPIILGANYDEDFKVGTEFEGEFSIFGRLKFRVVGRLEKDTSLFDDKTDVMFDDLMIIPTFSMENLDEKDLIIMLSMKIEGFGAYNNYQEFEKIADYINGMAEETGFKYDHIYTKKDYSSLSSEEYLKLRTKTIILGCFIILLFFFEIFIGVKKENKS